MVETAANKISAIGFWLRAVFVAFTVLGTVIATTLFDYYTALQGWYIIPGSGHYSMDLVLYYNSFSIKANYCVCIFVSTSCVGSACLLAGTIYWVRQMTLV
jgi:hypothetical protein